MSGCYRLFTLGWQYVYIVLLNVYEHLPIAGDIPTVYTEVLFNVVLKLNRSYLSVNMLGFHKSIRNAPPRVDASTILNNTFTLTNS